MVSDVLPDQTSSMHFLFVKHSLAWPRTSGHDVHTYHMMRGLELNGHAVSLLTIESPRCEAIEQLRLRNAATFDTVEQHLHNDEKLSWKLSWSQERFRSYWGITPDHIETVGRLAQAWEVDAVVAAGLEVLPYLSSVQDACRVWYAADEWVWHHCSVFKITDRQTWNHLRAAAVKGAYERAYRSCVDQVWVVSEADRRCMQWIAGMPHCTVVPNGVDAEYFFPRNTSTDSRSCVFWGRLDFEPNIQAIDWFCRQVWPLIRQKCPDANLNILGFNPTKSILALHDTAGIRVGSNLPDLRAEIARSQVAILPFQSGGGIKNKLLEAAAMGKPIVCTPRSVNGLSMPESSPFLIVKTPQQWRDSIISLWSDPQHARELGSAARSWVLEAHGWSKSAHLAAQSISHTRGRPFRAHNAANVIMQHNDSYPGS